MDQLVIGMIKDVMNLDIQYVRDKKVSNRNTFHVNKLGGLVDLQQRHEVGFLVFT